MELQARPLTRLGGVNACLCSGVSCDRGRAVLTERAAASLPESSLARLVMLDVCKPVPFISGRTPARFYGSSPFLRSRVLYVTYNMALRLLSMLAVSAAVAVDREDVKLSAAALLYLSESAEVPGARVSSQRTNAGEAIVLFQQLRSVWNVRQIRTYLTEWFEHVSLRPSKS